MIVIDALSERSPRTQERVQGLYQEVEINALVVTTRLVPDFGPKAVTLIWPEPITTEKCVYFLTEYLRRINGEALFPGRQLLQLADRLLALVEVRGSRVPMTPLLVKLFVEQAVSLRSSRSPIEGLPVSITEMFLDYLRRTNPEDALAPKYVDVETLLMAARVLGWSSLGGADLKSPVPHDSLVPRDFLRDRAEESLKAEGVPIAASLIVERLILNGVLFERKDGGASVLRFALDPLAEYMAGLDVVHKIRDDETWWKSWLSSLKAIDGYPQRISGFLAAFNDCVEVCRDAYRIPAFVAPWEETRAGRPR